MWKRPPREARLAGRLPSCECDAKTKTMSGRRRTTRRGRTAAADAEEQPMTTTTTNDDDVEAKTPERPARPTDDVSALLASPFLLFANALSPITPRAASLADGSEAASTRMGRRGSAFEPRSPGRLVFNSPDRNLRRGVTTSGMSDVEKLAFSIDASLRGSDSKSSAGASRGLEPELSELDVHSINDDRLLFQNLYDEFDDSVIGAVERGARPSRGDDSASKRSSTTGASMEWTKGFTKTLKNFDEDSPRVGTRSARRVSYAGSTEAPIMETPVQTKGANRRASLSSSKSTPSSVAKNAASSACRETLESKKCNCKKSKCLKLYCECFAAGAYCKDCSCLTCQNTVANADIVEKTRHQIELRNPNAFASKILGDEGDDARHTKGCHCKKSACLKKYCECFQAGVKCQDYCKCEGCKNKDDAAPGGASGPRGGTVAKPVLLTAKTTNKSKSRAKEAAVAAANAAKAMQDDLIIEDFKLEKLVGSPLRSFEHADDLSSEYSHMNKSVEQSPLRTLLLSEGVTLSPLFSNTSMPTGLYSPLRAGQMSPLRSGMMSPLTPGMRAGPGKYTIRSTAAGKAPPVPLFNDDSGEFKTPREMKRNSVFGGVHDVAKDGGLHATFTSPVPLRTPDVYE